MEIFEYSTFGLKWTVEVDRTMITFKSARTSKTIPRGTIKGIGVSIPEGAASYAGNRFGLAGFLLKKNIEESSGIEKNIDFHQIPKTSMLTIGYSETPDKVKEANIMLNVGDENCVRMLQKVQEEFTDLYIGAGPMALVRRSLGISDAKYVIVAVVSALLFIGLSLLYQTRHLFNSYL